MKGGNVWFPKHAPWLDEWESELLLFPNARHDDQVDVLAYAALDVAGRSRWPVTRPNEDAGRVLAMANAALSQKPMVPT